MTIKKENEGMHPKKLLLWIAMASMTMIFIAFTSAYIVRRAAGNWVEYKLPDMFIFSTIIILLSSFTIHRATIAFKRNNHSQLKLFLGVTTLLGILFFIFQYFGWHELSSYGIHLRGNPSGSFLFVISGVHAIHIAGGVIILFFLFLHAIIKLSDPVKALIYDTNPVNKLNLSLMATYWHFVDGLWIYLYLFFISNQSY